MPGKQTGEKTEILPGMLLKKCNNPPGPKKEERGNQEESRDREE
jgi:hypothetical protein